MARSAVALVLAYRSSHASARCFKYRAETSAGDKRSTSVGACHGSSGPVRSTPEWLSQLLADETSLVGTLAPWFRANSPITFAFLLFQGKASAPSANSESLGK